MKEGRGRCRWIKNGRQNERRGGGESGRRRRSGSETGKREGRENEKQEEEDLEVENHVPIGEMKTSSNAVWKWSAATDQLLRFNDGPRPAKRRSVKARTPVFRYPRRRSLVFRGLQGGRVRKILSPRPGTSFFQRVKPLVRTRTSTNIFPPSPRPSLPPIQFFRLPMFSKFLMCRFKKSTSPRSGSLSWPSFCVSNQKAKPDSLFPL